MKARVEGAKECILQVGLENPCSLAQREKDLSNLANDATGTSDGPEGFTSEAGTSVRRILIRQSRLRNEEDLNWKPQIPSRVHGIHE